jgi:hypothetical protein
MKYRQDRKTWKGIAPIMSAVIMGFALAIGLDLTACKGKSDAKIEDKPTEEQGKAAILNGLQRWDKERAIKLLCFHKTNGMDKETPYGKKYDMDFECDIEFTRACDWDPSLMLSPEFTFRQGTLGTCRIGSTGPDPDSNSNKRGAKAKVIGVIEFEKSENGWRTTYKF